MSTTIAMTDVLEVLGKFPTGKKLKAESDAQALADRGRLAGEVAALDKAHAAELRRLEKEVARAQGDLDQAHAEAAKALLRQREAYARLGELVAGRPPLEEKHLVQRRRLLAEVRALAVPGVQDALAELADYEKVFPPVSEPGNPRTRESVEGFNLVRQAGPALDEALADPDLKKALAAWRVRFGGPLDSLKALLPAKGVRP